MLLIVSTLSHAQVRSIISGSRLVSEYGIFNAPIPDKTIDIWIDRTKLLRDAEAEENSGMILPYRFGKVIDVNHTLVNSGTWFKIDSGRVWKLKIRTDGAYSISLIFSKLILSGQSELYIYNDEGSMLYGPVTSGSTTRSGKFNSDIIKGETAIIELYEPLEETGKNVLHLSKIVHGFRNIFQPNSFGGSFSCQDDVSCNPSWNTPSNGVAMIILANMERLCSGSLLNNTSQDFTPNILTAFHCIDIGDDIEDSNPCTDFEFGNGILSQQEIENAEDWIFRFQYKRSNCNQGSEPLIFFTFQEAIFRAGWFNTDFALVEMLQNPVRNVYNSGIQFLGWSRVNNAPTSGAFLGHPCGDVMKISTYNSSAVSNPTQIAWQLCNIYPYRYNYSPVNTHWNATINDGALEYGSSGGPFFNQNLKVVGQLHGGSVRCSPTTTHSGRFDVSWGKDNNGVYLPGRNAENSLAPWLDPNDTRAMTTNTIPIPSVSGPTLVCSSGGSFTVNNLPTGATITWSQGPNLARTSAQGANPCTFSSTGSGSSWIRATLVTSCGSVTLPDKVVWSGTPVISYISGPTYTPNNQWATYYAIPNNPAMGATDYNWILSPLNGNSVYDYGWTADIAFYNSGFYQVVSRGQNRCGWGGYTMTGIEVYDSKGMSIYPNPASGEVTIEIQSSDDKELPSTVWELEIYTPGMILKEKKTSLKDNKTIINTSGWQEGIYMLRVKHGESLLTGKLIIKR